jgi:hypothetical protein
MSKNILYYDKFDYCVFTVFDEVDEIKGTTSQQVYIMLNLIIICHYVVMGGIFYHNMICYWLWEWYY